MPADEDPVPPRGGIASAGGHVHPFPGADSLATLGLGELAGRAIIVLRSHTPEATELCRQLSETGFRRVDIVADTRELLDTLQARTDGRVCDVDLLIADQSFLLDGDNELGRRLDEHSAWRRIALLAVLPGPTRPGDLRVHARLPTLADVVRAGDTHNLLARCIAALRQRHAREHHARTGDIVDGIVVTLDTEGRVRDINRGGCDLLGYSLADLQGRDWFDACIPAVDAARLGEEHAAALGLEGEAFCSSEARVLTSGGEERSIAWRHSPWRAADGRVLGLLCCGHDVTDRNRVHKQLHWHASHDLLTGLLNRSELENRLSNALQQVRDGDAQHALAYLDIDQFKVINDTCGHEAGDELLRRLGALLPEHMRAGDVVARLGGDQFAVLMQDCGLDEAYRCTEAITRAVEAFRFLWDGRAHPVGTSVGLVAIDSWSESDAGLLSAADAACHAAKQRGGRRIHIYQPDDEEVVARQGEMQWVLRINRALDEDRFQLWLQPIRRVTSGAQNHGELLLRMVDDDGRMILPGAFLPAAERFHLSTRIDRWVVNHALGWLAGDDPVVASLNLCCINLSGLSLGDESFLEYTVNELHRQRIAGHRICFEITETAAIGNLSGAIRFIRALKEEGVRFALDDFGSGLSSFAYLKTLPVDYLKIDGVFVKDIANNPIDFAMVKSIHEVARVMGKETVGEYVENGPVLERLREIGVDYAQGYAVGRPYSPASVV